MPTSLDVLLEDACRRAQRYAATVNQRRVAPDENATSALDRLAGPLPDDSADPAAVLALLDDCGSPATVASSGGRYFGFVIGGSLPAPLAANWLAATWDQNAGLRVISPVAARLEEIALDWLCDLFHLPAGTGAGFVSGATMANLCGLAAARHVLLDRRR
jgi:glutamate/tyrosine decarboxylase-like PLP-dependent enzyme